MIEAALLIGAAIAGATEAVKNLMPTKVHGIVTIVVALLVGVLVAVLDTKIGVVDISIAQGIMLALSAIGVVGTVKKIG